jgi:hypothetical protein
MPQNPKYDGSDSGPIDLNTAKQWVANYRRENPNQTRAHYFGADIVKRILAEHDCSGIRIYYAIDDEGAKQLLIVGADSKGDNLLPASAAALGGGDNEIADLSLPCPTYCPDNDL